MSSYENNVEDFTLKHLLLFRICTSEICEKFVYKLETARICPGISVPLKAFLNAEQREILVNTFICASYNYCCLAWHFCFKKLVYRIERIHYIVLQFLHNDYDCDYNTLLKKSDKFLMEVQRLKLITLEIYRSLNDLNPSFMKN